jgi:hypothetical protein
MPLDAGSVTVGVRVLDEGKVDMTRYVSLDDHRALRQQLREAKVAADLWEERYWELLSQHGGVT